MSEVRRCLYCARSFRPSLRRPQQQVCRQPECQRRRRADSRRRQLATDPVYAQVVRESRKNWLEEHPDYQKRYYKEHPEAAERNRQQQSVTARSGRKPLRSCGLSAGNGISIYGPKGACFSIAAGNP